MPSIYRFSRDCGKQPGISFRPSIFRLKVGHFPAYIHGYSSE